MPDPEPVDGLRLVTDLRVELQSEHGAASAHLHGGSDRLVLDVDEPATLVRALGRRRRVSLPPELVGLVRATPVELRSRGRNLGRVTVTAAGKVRARPTPAGLVVAGHAVLAGASLRVLGAGGGIVLALVLAARSRGRHRA